jgi:hypothetical protein
MKKILPLFQLFYFKNVFNATFLMFLFTLPITILSNKLRMRKIKFVIALTASIFCTISKVESQTFNYNFTALASVFSPLPTGTVAIHGAGVDDALSAAIGIPFNFVYNCTPYNTFKVSSNGVMFLGSGAVGTNATNNLNTSTDRLAIAPLWDDLATMTTSGKVSYIVTGVSPNRVLQIEWLNMKWSWSATSEVISFQAKLYETTNVIEYIYRQDAGVITLNGASIGISGPLSGQFYSLPNTGINPIPSQVVEVTSIGVKPATGQLYRFTPATPTISLNNQNICSGGSATLIPSGGNTYTWSTSATTPSIVVSPVVNTVYTVQSGVTGCIGTQTAMVTVSVQPSSPAVTPSFAAVCGSVAPTFTASGSTGIYAWYNAINGPVLSTNTIYTTPTLTSSATYYLAASAATLQASVGTYTFTNAAAIGNIGPTQLQINTAYAASNLNGLVTITGQGIQNFTVPATGVYRIRARGAQGGFNGGLGAIMEGDFTLNAGEIIRIIVGQQGTGSNPGGGGGGSFVVRAPYTTTNSILVIAGGGSGAGSYATSPGLTTANGGFGGVAGGTNGTGGLGGIRGAGGGGFLTNGDPCTVSALYANPGIAFVNGGQGGAPTNNCAFNGAGGFGGGSSHGGNCIQNGGAGGGFSGGGGSSNTASGGGGSLNNGTNQTNQQGVNSGDGLVIIQPISVSSVAGCQSALVPITINVGPATPTITANNYTLCTGNTATIAAISTAGTYTWSNGPTTSSFTNTPVSNNHQRKNF